MVARVREKRWSGWLVIVVVLLGACSTQGRAAGAHGSSTGQAPSTTSSGAAPSDGGGDAGTTGPSRAAYSQPLNEALVRVLDQDDACVSGRAIDAIGLDRLHAAHLAPDDVFTAKFFVETHLTDAERDAFELQLTDALLRCGTSAKLARSWMVTDDPAFDVTPYVDCVAKNASPLLASVTLQAWNGMSRSSVDGSVDRALGVAMDECPDYAVALAVWLVEDAGGTVDDAQRACLRERFTEFADRRDLIPNQEWNEAVVGCT